MPRRSTGVPGPVGRAGGPIVFLNRRTRAGRWLEWKLRIFTVAAVFGLAGIALERRWLTGVAIVILLAGGVLRFLPTGGEAGDADRDEDGG